MEKYLRPAAIGVGIGTIASIMIALASQLPPAMANEQPLRTLTSTMDELVPRRINVANLVRFDDDAYLVTVDPSVSLEPVSTTRVSKIGYGKRSVVTVSRTATGVYSSDAMLSPHVKYPGIEVQRVDARELAEQSMLTYWLRQGGWDVAQPSRPAGSFIVLR